MITLVQKVVSYIVRGKESNGPQSDELERPRLEDFIDISPHSLESWNFEGTVTSVDGWNIVINKDIYYEVQKPMTPSSFSVGDRVSGVAHRRSNTEAWRATDVQLQQEAWDSANSNSTTDGNPQIQEYDSRSRSLGSGQKDATVISCRELEAGIPGIFKQDLLSSSLRKNSRPEDASCTSHEGDTSSELIPVEQCAIGKITGIFGDSVTLNENLHFRFCPAECSFQLMKGDWIAYKVDHNPTTEENGSDASVVDLQLLSSVEPLRRRRIRGEVSRQYSSYAVINEEVFCPKSVFDEALLQAGDSVIVDVIESDQERFCWRAVNVSPVPAYSDTPVKRGRKSSFLSNQLGLAGNVSSAKDDKILHLLENKAGIIISKSLRFPVVYLGKMDYIAAFVKNVGRESRTLRRVYIVSTSEDCQLSVDGCSVGGRACEMPVVIHPDSGISVRLQCTAMLLGLAKHLCVFDFVDFQVGRYVSAVVEDEQMHLMLPIAPRSSQQTYRKARAYQPSESTVIRGEVPFKPPPFLPVSLPTANIPSYLWDAVLEEKDILDVVPCLRDPLSRVNHKEKLSALLHLEEIAMTQQMRQFDMARSTLSPRGEYLSLSVPGLAERRPSLMVGDTVLVSSPCLSPGEGELHYEGYVHEVLHTQVLLKFHPTFHQLYRGEDYAIQFRFNRTPLRRCHFALDFAMKQLGPDVLFPTKLRLQLPQVSYVDLEVPTCVYRRRGGRTPPEGEEAPASSVGEGATGGPFSGGTSPPCPSGESLGGAEDRRGGRGLEEESRKEFEEEQTKSRGGSCESNGIRDEGEGGGAETEVPSGFKDGDDDDEDVVIEEECEAEEADRVCCSSSDPPLLGGKGLGSSGVPADGATDVGKQPGCDATPDADSVCRDAGRGWRAAQGGAATPEPKHTPPRIPVVTRLFGVPSSGSSSNSSKSFSDDEARELGGEGGRHGARTKTREANGACLFPGPADAGRWNGFAGVATLSPGPTSAKGRGGGGGGEHGEAALGGGGAAEGDAGENERGGDGAVCCQAEARKPDDGSVASDGRPYWNHTPSRSLKMSQTLLLMGLQGNRHGERKRRRRSQRSDHAAGEGAKDSRPVPHASPKQDPEPAGNARGSRVQAPPGALSLTSALQGREGGQAARAPACNGVEQAAPASVQNASGATRLPGRPVEGRGRPSTDAGGAEDGYCIPVLPINSLRRKGRAPPSQLPTLRWANRQLNAEQKLAVRRVLEGSTRPLPYVIYGPPGTGKTVTLVEAALQVLSMVAHSRLVIVTPSNSASDLVAERLLASGRLGHADLVRLNPFHRQEEGVPEALRPFSCNGDDLAVRVRQRVVVTTAATSGLLYTLGLHGGHFSHVFVDEAGQLTEPECLLALGLVNRVSGQIVVAGDPEQLGPVVHSAAARRFGLDLSFLHRLCGSVLYQAQRMDDLSWVYEPHLVTQLCRNYRSHPDILAVPSRLFYHDSLAAHADREKQEGVLGWSELPNPSCPLLFHGLVSDNCQEGDSPSWFNPAEAFQAVRYAKSLIEFGLRAQDIGIITPYRKQVEKIRVLLVTFGLAEGVKVGSVEEFQGQERKAVVVSTVRSSSELVEVDLQHSLGFVQCRRRFNVAVTRAQSVLVLVGNPWLLRRDECWRELIAFCVARGAYRGPDLDAAAADEQAR